MAKTLTNARFFLESDAHLWLSTKYEDVDVCSIKNCDFGFDIIDEPFYCAVSSGDEYVDIKLYIRNEMGVFLEDPDFGARIFANDEKPKVTDNTGRLGDAEKTILLFHLFFKAAISLNMYIAEKDMLDEFSNMNVDEEGILVVLNDDELSFERVSGKRRPAMACTTLLGGVQMMRPYQDEIMDSWMDEMLPLAEKIKMAEDGDENIMEQLAMAYLNGDDEVEVDPEKAIYWFTKLAELDNSNAQFNLGLHYGKGFGVERDFEKAVYWMKRAAENGDEDAPALIEKYTKAANAMKIIGTGDAQAQADLAGVLMALAGSLEQAGPGEDYAMAFDLASKSAAQNNGDGLWTLALAYEHGRGVDQDVEKAVECYRKGAALGHAPSQHSLACYYMRGEVLEEDYEKAFELCMKSAKQGYGLAMRDVGYCYQFGNGVDDDMSLAIEWYERALKVIDDPELERKVAVFKMLEGSGGFDAPAEEDGDADLDAPDGMIEALELQDFAEEAGYQIDVGKQGALIIVDEKMIAFVMELANAGNRKAQLVLAHYFIANECTDEQKAQAMIWMEPLDENANVYSESASTAESTMTCPHCNRTINSKDTFCIYCGKVVVTQNNIGDESIESLINRRAETLERINAANAEMLELEQKEQQLLAQTEDLAHQEANLQHAEEKLSRKRDELQQAQTAFRREAEEIGFHAE